ncbi:MAG: DUF5686 and carboxypeptidase regulatory-like domain-containing protein [Bacteroidales bacterium]|nr:DUF5686 and carboxypeptidase regulatory-like domain-containing protein [Bacteroidales bacterium]
MRTVLRGIILSAIFILVHITALAQATKVKGRVIDSETLEGVPFAGIYFEGTTIGVSTDLDGFFSLETRETSAKTLKASILGYESQSIEIKPGVYNEINFTLKPIYSQLSGVTIKADDRKVRRLLKNILANKDSNNPEQKSTYECDTYTKMELDIVEAGKHLGFKGFKKNFGFVFEYMDTSIVNGKSYLPALISETLAHNYHQKSPSADKEKIIANKISGIEETPTLAQFAGSMHARTNLYDNFIDIFDVNIPSPLASTGNMYYDYYLIDSLEVNGRKTYKIRFHPEKMISSPAFDGEINIDAEDYAIQEAHIKLFRAANVAWIKDMTLDLLFERSSDGWFYKQDKMFIEFSPDKKDNSPIVTFFGTRQIDYSNPEIGKPLSAIVGGTSTNVITDNGVVINDEKFWEVARPYPLSEKEKNIYSMVDDVKSVPMFGTIYDIAKTLVDGYYDFHYLSYGPYYKTFSFNNLEGARFQLGGRTSHAFSKNTRYTAYVAYGTKDKKFKGGGSIEMMFGSQPTRKLTLGYKKDVVQLGRSNEAFVESNIMASIMSKGNTEKLSPLREFSVRYDHEFTPGINSSFGYRSMKVFGNSFVPMFTPSGDPVKAIQAREMSGSLRFSWDEMITRGSFEKQYLYSDYPIITLSLSGSFDSKKKEFLYSYLRPEITLEYRLMMPPFGTSTMKVNAGKIFGKVPYPFLKLHEGNGSYFLDTGAFACMDYYEFASDQWATLFYRHNFKGFFLGKIPLLKKLGWRENVIAKIAYGTLRAENDGSLGESSIAPLAFPDGMSSLKKPYVEVGVGISNIFRLIRIDAYRRVTHSKEGKNFAINVGLEAAF